jgi:CRP-like cAMP-binding protein
MHVSQSPGLPSRNRVLAALPPDELAAVVALGDLVELHHDHVLQEAGGRVTQVYFPVSAAIGLVGGFGEVAAVEVGTVGNEGILGIGAFLADDLALFDARCVAPGWALRVPVEALSAGSAPPSLSHAARRYAYRLVAQAAHTAACNCSHKADQRIARWLLLTHDRVASDEFPLTHAFAAGMLGVGRPTATLALGRLRRAGVVAHRREWVVVRDRARLEQAACPCYWRIRSLFDTEVA